MWQRGQWLAWTNRIQRLKGVYLSSRTLTKNEPTGRSRIRADASMNVKAQPGSENDPLAPDHNKMSYC